MPPDGRELAPGLVHFPGYLDGHAQKALAGDLLAILAQAPPYTPRMPRSGRPFSVRMSNCGPLGWVSERDGYRYRDTHPETGKPWPAMPAPARDAWRDLARYPSPPEACLINLYAAGTRMGLHQDRDEADASAPVISLSLGATALFRYGGLARSDPTRSVRLASGDALVMGGASRLAFHGIDRLLEPEPGLLSIATHGEGGLAADFLQPFLLTGGRCNLTLRRVTLPAAGA